MRPTFRFNRVSIASFYNAAGLQWCRDIIAQGDGWCAGETTYAERTKSPLP